MTCFWKVLTRHIPGGGERNGTDLGKTCTYLEKTGTDVENNVWAQKNMHVPSRYKPRK